MKKMIFLIGILTICISACGIKQENPISESTFVPDTTIKEDVQNKKEFVNAEDDDGQPKYTSNGEEQENPISENAFVADTTIKEVVQNKKKFVNAETGQSIYLNDFRSDNYLYVDNDGQYQYTSHGGENVYSFESFCVLDMDGDGFPEVLIQTQESHRLVLHYEDGTVYGFLFPFRGMKKLKKDGSFEGSGGAILNFLGSVVFSKGNVMYNELCFYDGMDHVYRVNKTAVSQETAEDYFRMQEKKENAEWYPYHESNIEKYFSAVSSEPF